VKSSSIQLTEYWRGTLADYVTALAWSPEGDKLATASAAGEVVLHCFSGPSVPLMQVNGRAINSLTFSTDGRFLAAGGQSGVVTVWDMTSPDDLPGFTQSHPGVWIDQLTWHPHQPHLAYGVGSQVHVWDLENKAQLARLAFQDSSVLHLAWHPGGGYLAVSGHGGLKVWFEENWTAAPKRIAVPGVSLYGAWSSDGRYLGSGNFDRTLTVAEWDSPPPWLMQGFPGKVRQLSWSTPITASGSPLLAASCAEGITVWERNQKLTQGQSNQGQSNQGWRSQVLQHHQNRVNRIAFQPNSLLLASASQDGGIALWQDGKKLVQQWTEFDAGISSLTWSPSGDRLAVGSTTGALSVRSLSHRGKGFH